ncbi:hypothetical protein [Kordiimonas aestuarii]|uniref:hypothetical protein n=1 Tax=Kordiimonas aestuarii TaxID=1005925 RepID=UPI0021CFB25D|nr:hypothetical protein [Kordiimonas aestuarii]
MYDQMNTGSVVNNYQLYMRDDFDDDGSIPSGARTASCSPDIVPRVELMRDPPELISPYGWDQDYGEPLVEGIPNYIYVRGASRDNIGTAGPVVGQVNLFSVPSCLFMTPDRWDPVDTSGESVTLTSTANEQHLLGSEPFIWTPPERDIHYCLVSQITTEAEPNSIPDSFANNGAFIDWVINDPAIAWRNLVIQENTTETTSYAQTFGNIDNHTIQVMFTVQCIGFDYGSQVQIMSQSSCLGSMIDINRTINSSPYDILVADTVTAVSDGVLGVFVTPPQGLSIPAGAKVHIQYLQVAYAGAPLSKEPESNDLLMRHAKPFEAFGFATKLDNAPTHAVRLGEVTITYADG